MITNIEDSGGPWQSIQRGHSGTGPRLSAYGEFQVGAVLGGHLFVGTTHREGMMTPIVASGSANEMLQPDVWILCKFGIFWIAF
jgi:hypothetical protein